MNLEQLKKAVEVSDGHIELGKPLELIKVCDCHGKKKKFIIHQVNFHYEWEKFSTYLGIFLSYYYQVITATTLPDKLNELNEFRDNIRLALRNNQIVNQDERNQAYISLQKLCEFSGVGIKWMKTHFTLDDWIEIFIYFYLYNIAGKKKILIDALNLIGIARYDSQKLKPRFTYSSKKSTASLN